MSIIYQLLHEELIDLNNSSTTIEEFFEVKSATLLKLGYVADTYETSLLQREQEYPTGLGMEFISIAIPHTTIEHVKKPFIYFNRLSKKGIKFIQMGTDDVIVEPEYILMLGITNPKEQVDLLAELMYLFNDKEFIEAIIQAKTSQEIIKIFRK